MSKMNTIHFNLAKKTPGALKYEEVDGTSRKPLRQNDDGCNIGTVYLRKSAPILNGKEPATLTITIEVK